MSVHTQPADQSASVKKKMSVLDFQKYKDECRKFA